MNSNIELSRRGFVTNYPPFRLWHRGAAREILKEETINIYVHIPFCIQKCAYCYYMTVALKDKPDIDRYVKAVCREIEIATERFHLKERPVKSIYFGGGTPALLKETQLSRLIKCLHENLNIDEPEFTIEVEPLVLKEKKTQVYGKLGINRISIGVQSFSDDIIKLSGRRHTEKQALSAIEIAQKTNNWIVNIDLLSGLAGETTETWVHTLECALSTNVSSITIYKMEAYSNTGFAKDVLENGMILPDDDEELEFMRYALSMLESNCYLPWCFFTFTKNGKFPNVYASSIWRGGDLYGFGASSFGNLGRCLFQNYSLLPQYIRSVEAGELPIWRGNHITSVDEVVRAILLGMKLTSIDIDEFQQRLGINLTKLCSDSLKELIEEGFVTVSDSTVQMTSKGMLYGDYVGKCMAIDAAERLEIDTKTDNFTKTYQIWS